jgi:imidazolonepropionase-like amidohydrolase
MPILVFVSGFSCSILTDKEPVTAFVNVNVVPMTQEVILSDQMVLVGKGRITAVGSPDKVKIPGNAFIIDGKGAYLMPGLADMHMHMRADWQGPNWPVSPLNLYLGNGVTTVRCFGGYEDNMSHALHWRDEIDEGKLTGPHIYSSGEILFGPVENPGEKVREQKSKGFDFIKIYSFVSREEFREIIMSARKSRIYTAGHIPFSVGLDGVLEYGMDEIAHVEELDFEFLDFEKTRSLNYLKMFRYILREADRQTESIQSLDIKSIEKRYEKKISEIVEKLKAKDIPVCTTISIGGIIEKKLHDPEAFRSRPENRYMEKNFFYYFDSEREKHQVMFRGHEDFARFKWKFDQLLLRKLMSAGVPLVLGTDAGGGGMGIIPGYSVHDELRILTENGFTPYEAIRTGTVNAAMVAEKMTGRGDFGTVEAGKRADLVLVQNNPLSDVANIKKLRGVMASGRWYSEDDLDRMITIPGGSGSNNTN